MNGKPSSPVLRGLGASDGARLLDPYRIMEGQPAIHFEQPFRGLIVRTEPRRSHAGVALAQCGVRRHADSPQF